MNFNILKQAHCAIVLGQKTFLKGCANDAYACSWPHCADQPAIENSLFFHQHRAMNE